MLYLWDVESKLKILKESCKNVRNAEDFYQQCADFCNAGICDGHESDSVGDAIGSIKNANDTWLELEHDFVSIITTPFVNYYNQFSVFDKLVQEKEGTDVVCHFINKQILLSINIVKKLDDGFERYHHWLKDMDRELATLHHTIYPIAEQEEPMIFPWGNTLEHLQRKLTEMREQHFGDLLQFWNAEVRTLSIIRDKLTNEEAMEEFRQELPAALASWKTLADYATLTAQGRDGLNKY